MVTGLLWRGLLVGLAAGILAFGVGRVLGEPQLDRAIAFEQQVDRTRGETPGPELVSRKIQAGVGLLTASLIYGTALGGLLALAFAFGYGRAGDFGPRALAAWLALAGFLLMFVVPALKYPPNPPAIGDPQTIGRRTALYFVMVGLSLTVGALAIGLAQRLAKPLGVRNAALAGALAFVAVIAAAAAALPPVDEAAAGFSTDVLWRFRIASLAVQATLWATLGVGFGITAKTALGHSRRA